mgnify:CR=1 FL=1
MTALFDAMLADGPVLFWVLDEASGTTFADSSTNGNHGTLTGTNVTYRALSSPAQAGVKCALDMRPTTRIEATLPGFSGAQDWSITLWIASKRRQVPNQYFLGMGNTELQIFGRRIGLSSVSAPGSDFYQDAFTVPVFQWTQITIVCQTVSPVSGFVPSSAAIWIYQNGGRLAQTYFSRDLLRSQTDGPYIPLTGNTHFTLGHQTSSPRFPAPINAAVSHVAIYPYKLTAAQIYNQWTKATNTGFGTLWDLVTPDIEKSRTCDALVVSDPPSPFDASDRGNLWLGGDMVLSDLTRHNEFSQWEAGISPLFPAPGQPEGQERIHRLADGFVVNDLLVDGIVKQQGLTLDRQADGLLGAMYPEVTSDGHVVTGTPGRSFPRIAVGRNYPKIPAAKRRSPIIP